MREEMVLGEDPCRNGLEKDVFGIVPSWVLILGSAFENTFPGPALDRLELVPYSAVPCLACPWNDPAPAPPGIFGEPAPCVCTLWQVSRRQVYLHDQVMLI